MEENQIKLKAAVFIDHSNIASPLLGPSCKHNQRIDYKKLKDLLLNGYEDGGAFIFMGVPDTLRPEKKDFIEYLGKVGYHVLTRPLAKRKDGSYEQKQIDIFMTVYMDYRAQFREFDVALILSGDADFVIAANMLQDMNIGVVVWSWREALSLQLREAVGESNIFYLDDIWKKIKK